MKPEELQLEDIVVTTPSGMPIRIAAIHRKKVAYHACNDSFSWVRIGLLQPIPLTPEILEKNGFELYEQDFTSNKVYVFDKGFTYIEDCGNYFVIGANVEYEHFGRKLRFISSTIKIYYVHELQHALRMCGINKKIEI